jgi:hypothetical protein
MARFARNYHEFPGRSTTTGRLDVGLVHLVS